MPDWPCLEDECEFGKDPVKVIGLYSLLLLAKSLLHAPLSFKHAVATFKKKKVCSLGACGEVFSWFRYSS